ncbi:MAG: hypothetical protein UX13_C0011G0007 [Candidatus Woesebacteria bacterium GW2011_GWB1_45_5]|uniref:Uncharacterized protein n=1 Tax=Candidatus Woesebacteria bacterium GW2011_GWB1_45_5 TaxID=1618581 RepID=A0A0G1MQ25_9BACT|nr:MAG: hypothetical protein UX13_C0011G0007 [Candidatus Woesebacteria bacterium GW2011_GWB1_45_5]
MEKGRQIWLFVFVLSLMGLLFVVSIIGVTSALDEYRAGRASVFAERSELVTILRIGEHFVAHCEDGVYFVLPYMATPDQIGILQGSDARNQSAVIDISGSEHEYLLGCFKIRIVPDPSSLYMLEVYQKP